MIVQEPPTTMNCYLSSITADFPARGEVNQAVKSGTAKLVCMFCSLLGIYLPDHKTTRYFGWSEPTEMNGDLVDRPDLTTCQLGVNDDIRMLSSQQHKDRAGEKIRAVGNTPSFLLYCRMPAGSPSFSILVYQRRSWSGVCSRREKRALFHHWVPRKPWLLLSTLVP